MIVVNASWRSQRVTGQQRYASEISRRLLSEEGVVVRPTSPLTNRWLAWGAVQALGVPRSRTETLLTLTSRGPVWHPRQVVTVHDHFVLTHPEWYSDLYVATHAPILRAQIRTATGLVFVSEATRDQHHAMFGDRHPHVVAPNGVQPPVGITPHALPGHRPYLFAVASADPRKNLSRLVEAYARLPVEDRGECPLVLVGGEEGMVFGHHGAAMESVVGVLRLGYVDDDSLWSLYRGARAVVVPSLSEGFGLPLVEAAAVGTPLLVSDIPVFRWIAGEQALYFDPLDVESLRATLMRAVSTEKADLPLVSDVSQRFSWDVSARSVLSFARGIG